MKKFYIISALLFCVITNVSAQSELRVTAFEYAEDSVTVGLEIDLEGYKVCSGESAVFVPTLRSDGRSAFLPAVVVKGSDMEWDGELYCEFEKRGEMVSYSVRVPYEVWMLEARLMMVEVVYDRRGVRERYEEELSGDVMFVPEVRSVSVFDFVPTVGELSEESCGVLSSKEVVYYGEMVEEVRYVNIVGAVVLIDYLEGLPRVVEVVNLLGGYYYICGNYARAREYFEEAVEMGSSEAKSNLANLEIKECNTKDLEVIKAERIKIYGKYHKLVQ